MSKKSFFFASLVVSFFAFGCYETQDGCLDLDATNFSLDADNACDGCCEYPQLRVAFLHRLTTDDSTGIFNLNQKFSLPTNPGQFFSIQKLGFYLADFELVGADGTVFSTTDSTDFKVLQSGDTLQKKTHSNFLWMNRANFSETSVGSIRAYGHCQKIRLKIGFSGDVLDALPGSFPSSHPLNFQQPDTINWDAGDRYHFLHLEMRKDTFANSPSSLIKITEPDAVNVEFAANLELKRGFNITLNLRVNYLDWFRGVDFEKDSDSVIRDKVYQNLPGSLVLVSVSFR